ncbi:MAG: hypothetical protein J6K32_08805 [Clostridia bacterium]|nr:hypothetical protein [Clostridia bacterium]
MLRRWIALLALLCMFCAPALAQHTTPAEGPAATAVSAQLLASPMRGAQALMNYWPGVRVQVTRVVSPEYVQVNVGAQPGSLMGYMRADALYYGEAGVRMIQPYQLRYQPAPGERMYTYCDAMAQTVAPPEYTYFNVIGETDGWLHLMEDGPDVFYAFAPIGDWTGDQEIEYFAPFVRSAPLETEITTDEAIAYAKERILADGIRRDETGELITREMLDQLVPVVRVLWYFDQGGHCEYAVEFWYAQGMEGYPYLCTGMTLSVEGGEITDASYGNG